MGLKIGKWIKQNVKSANKDVKHFADQAKKVVTSPVGKAIIGTAITVGAGLATGGTGFLAGGAVSKGVNSLLSKGKDIGGKIAGSLNAGKIGEVKQGIESLDSMKSGLNAVKPNKTKDALNRVLSLVKKSKGNIKGDNPLQITSSQHMQGLTTNVNVGEILKGAGNKVLTTGGAIAANAAGEIAAQVFNDLPDETKKDLKKAGLQFGLSQLKDWLNANPLVKYIAIGIGLFGLYKIIKKILK